MYSLSIHKCIDECKYSKIYLEKLNLEYPMAVHELKTVNPWFNDVVSGLKRFEIRLNDRNFQVGDTLLLMEYDTDTQSYTGKEIKKLISGIYESPKIKHKDSLKPGYVVLDISEDDDDFVAIFPHGKFRNVPLIDRFTNPDVEVTYIVTYKYFPQGINEGYDVVGLKELS